jgi:peptide/nickel transport system substrate-binding protein
VVRRSSRNFLVVLIICLVALAGAGAYRFLRPGATVAAPAVPSGGSLVSSLRTIPRTFNRFVDSSSASEVIAFLTSARLVRINRVTMDLEPMLAESWTRSADNLTYTVKLRRGVKFSDGSPFSSADVVFSFRAAYDEKTKSVVGDTLRVHGKPLEVAAVDTNTVSIKFPAPFGPGLRILDNLPICPRHLLEKSLNDGTFAAAWDTATPPAKLAGLGPFVLRDYQAGQRLVFERNPNYWRKDASGARLPYLDRITLEIITDQNAELLRLQSGQIDCMPSEIRAEDYAMLKQGASAGRLHLSDLGVGLDADSLWFNLRKDAKIAEGRRAWLQHVELRRAISEAVDRKRFADTVFLGAAVPVFGPVSPANKAWFDPQVPVPSFDRARAAARLASIGLKNKGADGVLVDAAGQPARITLITQKGNTALERGAAVIRDDLKTIGLAIDIVPLDPGAIVDRWGKGDFDLIYFRFLTTDVDPAGSLDFWLSSGGRHLWNPGQAEPATDWERRMDDLMARQVASLDQAERKRLFGDVQRLFADQVPLLYFAAPHVFVATSSRVLNATPVLMRPVVLWSAETLAVQKRAGTE